MGNQSNAGSNVGQVQNSNLQYSKSASNLNSMQQHQQYLNVNLGERGGTHQPQRNDLNESKNKLINNYIDDSSKQKS